MKTTFFIILIIALFAYSGNPKIIFSPFKITMEKPAEFFGLIFLALSIGCLKYQADKDGFKKGVEASIEVIKNSNSDSAF